MKNKKLKELVEINSESITKNYNEDKINYLDTSNITNGKIDNIVELDVKSAPSRAKRIVRENDIIYSTVRPNLCHYGILRKTLTNMIVSTGFVVLRCKKEVLPEYLYAYITLPSITMKMQAIAETSTSAYPSIKPKDLEDIDIIIPPIDIQQKISQILSNIDKKIELNNKINDNLQEVCNDVFVKWFCNYDFPNMDGYDYKSTGGIMVETELGKIPKEWKIGIFQDIIDFSNGYSFKSDDLLENAQKDTFKVFKQGNINIFGGINEKKTKSWYYKAKSKGLEKYVLKKGDILMCMTDMKNSTSPLLGHTALMNVDNEYIVNQRVGLIRCKKEFVDYPYVYTMSNLEYFLKNIRSKANSGVQVNLSTRSICETKIIIPSKDIIDKYDTFAKPLYEIMFNNQKENQALQQLRDTLLPKLMNGKINLDKIKI